MFCQFFLNSNFVNGGFHCTCSRYKKKNSESIAAYLLPLQLCRAGAISCC